MPFVQRVVNPVYLSRSPSHAHYNARSRTCCITTEKNSHSLSISPAGPSSGFGPGIQQTTTTTTTVAITTTTTQTVIPVDSGSGSRTHTFKGSDSSASAGPIHSNGAPSDGEKPPLCRNRNNNHYDSSCSSATLFGCHEPPLPLPPVRQTHPATSTAATDPQLNINSISYATDVEVEEDVAADASAGAETNSQPSRSPSGSGTHAKIVTGYEFESISNITLSNALRQLASLVIIANDIFLGLNKELQSVGERSKSIKLRIDGLENRVSGFDPKLVTVPVSDLGTFAQRKTHFKSVRPIDKELFTSATRPNSVKVLYEEAAKNPVQTLAAPEDISAHRHSNCTGGQCTAELVCTPVFGKAHRKMRTKIDAEIEIRLPAAIDDLRKWTSSEAVGDVTVTPDCVNRVDTSICTITNIGENGILTTALSPSVLSADAVDALYSINTTSNDSSRYPNEICKDVPLNHRLPSPEEQCKLIALKYPAEVISVDTSGRRFERMSMARKSTAGCFVSTPTENNFNEDIQTVSRRSRSRKVRGKRRNTIAGIDQKEIQDAAIGESNSSDKKDADEEEDEESKRFGRSHSSDVLKKDRTVTFERGKTLTRLNSLKQWGRNRFKFIIRNDLDAKHQRSPPKAELDIDESCKVSEIVALAKNKNDFFEKKESRFSHERKPSYSSSEKSVTIVSNKLPSGILAGNVKLRDTSSLNRQRRNAGFASHKDEPHSSSGNWSASSESGRASIGSEITIQPKSSASNTSLNNSSFHPGSGPPSSIISRRRFMNTSASSSVTSDGTATPDLQVNEVDDETSSAYSCDTEGYYTSFHMDSGLRTLKEEEPMTPLHVSSVHPSNYSFGSISNQTVLTAENEYELFGRGSTSTTTSSAGTVVTALLTADNAPDVPERISSLSKLNKSASASTSTLERSYSSSTIGSTLERTGTIKRNVAAIKKEVATVAVVHDASTPETPESVENEFNFSNRGKLPLPPPAPTSECSESSDFEGVERIERIKQKTVLNSQRIPSMCIITPTTSDDENFKETLKTDNDTDPNLPSIDINLNNLKHRSTSSLNSMFDRLKVVLPNIKKSPSKITPSEPEEDIYDIAGEYVTIADISNNNNKNPRTNLGNLGIYYSNDVVRKNLASVLSGNVKRETEYVSLNELPSNIRGTAARAESEQSMCAKSATIKNSPTHSAQSACTQSQSQPLNESTDSGCTEKSSSSTQSQTQTKGARVKMNAQGKIVYDSDSLKRRKGAHTTFAPGPYVKETESALLPDATLTPAETDTVSNSESPADIDSSDRNRNSINFIGGCANRKLGNVRPVVSHRPPTIVNMTTKCIERPATASSTPVLSQGYQHLAKPVPSNDGSFSKQPVEASSAAPFNRNQPQYWTLQNRRPTRTTPSSSSRDDLYATPISKMNRNAVLRSDAPLKTNISPIVPRNKGNNFQTSTPTKNSGEEAPDGGQSTCSDRIGNSKTTLMDFKKLLLAKSTKTNPVQKLSAVEMLKLNKARENAALQTNQTAPVQPALNSSMPLLDLSGSPKTFANRRMLRQGQFGSPSKTFMSKQRQAAWRMNATRTDVMSTTIPEANSEDDHTSTSSSSKANSESGETVYERNISEEPIDLKNNIFLQTEENNFMRAEAKSQLLRSANPKFISNNNSSICGANAKHAKQATEAITRNDATANKEANMFPALETAL